MTSILLSLLCLYASSHRTFVLPSLLAAHPLTLVFRPTFLIYTVVLFAHKQYTSIPSLAVTSLPMKVAILPTAATLLVAVQGTSIHCNAEHPLNSASGDLIAALGQAIAGPILCLCNEGASNLSDILSLPLGNTTFQIIPQNEDDAELSLQECKTAFESIVRHCVEQDKMWGGELVGEDFTFDIHHTELRKRDIDNIGIYDDDDGHSEDYDFAAFDLGERDVFDHIKDYFDDDDLGEGHLGERSTLDEDDDDDVWGIDEK